MVAESIALVRSATEPGVWMRWDYDSEDPHADMRGFRVEELRQDTDEANYFAQDAQRELSFVEIKSDLVLGNGARFYNDHAHPEYCTPECSTLDELVAHDRAGERILMALRASSFPSRTRRTRFGSTRTTPISAGTATAATKIICCRARCHGKNWRSGIQAFLVTRQIFAGAGKFAIEEEDKFHLARISDLRNAAIFSANCKASTRCSAGRSSTRATSRTPIRNVYRRFHVIIGDANMSPFATRLKVGVDGAGAGSVGRVIRSGVCPTLGEPLQALAAHFARSTFQWDWSICRRARLTSAVDIQREYLRAVKEVCELDRTRARAKLVADWEEVLNDLARCDALPQPAGLGGETGVDSRISGGAKYFARTIRGCRVWIWNIIGWTRRKGFITAWNNRARMAADRIAMRWLRYAMRHPPASTRAYIRGRCIQKFCSSVIAAQWDHITLEGDDGPIKISLLGFVRAARRSCIMVRRWMRRRRRRICESLVNRAALKEKFMPDQSQKTRPTGPGAGRRRRRPWLAQGG